MNFLFSIKPTEEDLFKRVFFLPFLYSLPSTFFFSLIPVPPGGILIHAMSCFVLVHIFCILQKQCKAGDFQLFFTCVLPSYDFSNSMKNVEA